MYSNHFFKIYNEDYESQFEHHESLKVNQYNLDGYKEKFFPLKKQRRSGKRIGEPHTW